MKVIVDVKLTSEGHETKFRVEDYKTLENGAIDVAEYKKCLVIAAHSIYSTLEGLTK